MRSARDTNGGADGVSAADATFLPKDRSMGVGNMELSSSSEPASEDVTVRLRSALVLPTLPKALTGFVDALLMSEQLTTPRATCRFIRLLVPTVAVSSRSFDNVPASSSGITM